MSTVLKTARSAATVPALSLETSSPSSPESLDKADGDPPRLAATGEGVGERQEAGDSSEYHFVKPEFRALPILSGLVCPFSVLLDIPGLTTRWYIRTDGYNIVETQPNPALLDVGQAISLAFGVVANAALVWRFLEHRPRICTWVAIVALTMHDAINITIVTWFGVVHRGADGFTYGDAFWLSVASTAASTFCNITLVLDLARTKNFDKKGSGLTEKQRTLVIATMVFFVYLSLGALCFSYLIGDLTFIDALYFVCCTVTSVGFGDIVPVTAGARVFCMIYAAIGLVLLALTIAVARETIIETFEANYRSRRDKLAERARARKEEARRRMVEGRERRRRAVEEGLRLGRAEGEAAGEEEGAAPPGGGRRGIGALAGKNGSKGQQVALDMRTRTLTFSAPTLPDDDDGNRLPQDSFLHRLRQTISRPFHHAAKEVSFRRSLEKFRSGTSLDRQSSISSRSSTLTSSSLDESFRSLKYRLVREQREEFRIKLGISFGLFLIFWLGGSAIFMVTERWTYGVALYFSCTYFLTIGFGDFSPHSAAGRAFFVAWALLGVANMTLLLSVLTESWSSRYKSSIDDGRLKKTMRRLDLRKKPDAAGNNIDNASSVSLLASEGYTVPSQPIPPHELPEKIVETIKGFHKHARYFLLGRTGDPPPQLRFLLEAADEVDEKVESLVAGGATSLADSGAQGDTKHYLFMVSQFDALVDSAEQLSQAIKTTTAELEALNVENDRLRAELLQLQAEHSAGEPPPVRHIPFPFVHRPPGGFGDEEVEEELVEEVDEADEKSTIRRMASSEGV
ncbi:potassium channel subfamily K, other eukaryote [Rhodotorula toruloides]|uniref:Potassium channel subfamily K, other eukaryote n=1 Tax=Rhodotorula toruloides TaxID=5286 RepID=A0A511KKB0_RHOTO|nr:potassium channel subfamily K, other eukaryote [Rhodotorula toruloides]